MTVNETKSEVKVEMTTTSANSTNWRPPLNERDRQEDDDVDQRDHDGRRADFLAAFDRRRCGIRAEFGVVTLDVLQHDGRVVDQDADHERHAQQRHRVEREVEELHERDRDRERRRDRHADDDRAAPRAQEENHRDAGQRDRLEQGAGHEVDLLFGEDRLHVDDPEIDGRKLAFDQRQRFEHGVGGIDFARIRGLLDLQEEAGLAVDLRVLAARFVARDRLGDVLDTQHGFGRSPRVDGAGQGARAAEAERVRRRARARGAGRRRRAARDRQRRDALEVGDVAAHVDRRLAVGLVRDAAGNALVAIGDRIDHVVEREVIRREFGGIDFDFVGGRDVPADAAVGDAGHLFEPRDDHVIGIQRELAGRQALRVERHRHDRRFGGIANRDRGRREVGRQLPFGRLQILLREREVGSFVGAQGVGCRDRRLPLLDRRVERLQVGRAGQLLFDRRDDVVAHLGDRRAVIADADRDGRLADVGKELLDDRRGREDAREEHQRDQHEDERRTTDEKPGQTHRTATFSPSPTLV